MKKKISASIYDFDHTVYDGDCLIDFWLYLLPRRPLALFLIPLQFFMGILFLLRIIRLSRFKSFFLLFVHRIKADRMEKYLRDFWARRRKGIFPWVRDRLADEHRNGLYLICNSASPRFILEPMVAELGFDLLICTEFEVIDGRLTNRMIGTNCRGEEKVRRIEKWTAEQDIELRTVNAYSDHLSDIPLFELAENSFLINRGKIIPYHSVQK
jgi:HAD superfamily hydrolase (TIGR01490 family)